MTTNEKDSVFGFILIALVVILMVTIWCFQWNAAMDRAMLRNEEINNSFEQLESTVDEAWEAMSNYIIGTYYSDYHEGVTLESN